MNHKSATQLLSVLVLSISCFLLAACGGRTVRIDLVPSEDRLVPQMVEEDTGWFVRDRIALVPITGLLTSSRNQSMLSEGENQVSDLRETLNTIERDSSVKAVILRVNSPGGTITASDMMYRDIMAFKKRTGKPVVTCMLDVCASGGYYISCATDYRIAYPSTITGSIGVIIQTINFSDTLGKLGISAKAFTSGPNKDMLSPLRPLNASDSELAQNMVNEFYAQFVKTVKESNQHVKNEDWGMLTDGRVVTGTNAAKAGLIDQVGDINDAIAKAKELAGIKAAKIIEYTRENGYKGSAYAAANPPTAQVNMININADLSELIPATHPQFLYLWTGQ